MTGVQTCALPISFDWCPFLEKVTINGNTQIGSNAILVSDRPVSYTHLDVYKRQGVIECIIIKSSVERTKGHGKRSVRG